MTKYLREKLMIQEYSYPYAAKINPSLYSLVETSEDDRGKHSTVHAKMTRMNLKSPEVDRLVEWVLSLIKRDFRVTPCEAKGVWGVMYNNGDYIGEHNHQSTSTYSFVYYVNTPKGSSPLVFSTSRYKVKPIPGKLVLFESRLYHYIPPNKCNQRCIISGNFLNHAHTI